jgi:hypothetical protein
MISPMPGYLKRSYCEDKKHIINHSDASFKPTRMAAWRTPGKTSRICSSTMARGISRYWTQLCLMKRYGATTSYLPSLHAVYGKI